MGSPKPLTQKAALEEARRIIDGYPLETWFSSAHVDRLADLSDTDLHGVVRKRNPKYPSDTRHLHVVTFEWLEPRQWSWRSAITIAKARDPEAAAVARIRDKQLYALRYSVKTDMEEFRYAATPQECAACKETDGLTTDHVAPPFIRIAEAFLAVEAPLTLRSVPGAGDVIADPDVEAEWITFHAARATYQLLCRSCNSSKGARDGS